VPPSSPQTTLSLVETRCVLCGSDRAEPFSTGVDFEYATVPDVFTFVRCSGCDHLYLNPRPSSDALGTIYPSNYYAWEEGGTSLVSRVRRRWEGGKVALYRDSVGAGPRRLLDVGCGNGRFLSLLRDFGPEEWTLEGIDFDASVAEKCRAQGFTTHGSRVEDFDPGDARYDAVIMLQLIEHVEDPAAICERVFEILKPGGCFIVETPNLAGLDFRWFQRSHWGHYHFPRHWNLFSTSALQRLLRSKGFEIERSESLISTSAWTISLHNVLLDRGWPEWIVRFFHFQNPLLLGIFLVLDWTRARLGFETSNQRVIARRPEAP
jgi:2-polyprenyl-3-methyl-5-hydroxy-6-metoxy-1,4-benzoquinol methylase